MIDGLELLELEDLLEIAKRVAPHGAVRDFGALASAVARPNASAFGEYAYPTFESKVAALMHSLCRSHGLVDGNKRLAWAAGRVMCILNGRDLEFHVDEVEAFMLALTRGDLDVEAASAVVRSHLQPGD